LQTFDTSLPETLSKVIWHYRGPGTKSRQRKLDELEGSLSAVHLLCQQRTKEVLQLKDEWIKMLELIKKAALHPFFVRCKPSLVTDTSRMWVTSPLSIPLESLLSLALEQLSDLDRIETLTAALDRSREVMNEREARVQLQEVRLKEQEAKLEEQRSRIDLQLVEIEGKEQLLNERLAPQSDAAAVTTEGHPLNPLSAEVVCTMMSKKRRATEII
jgi:hypothetical protein